MYINIECEKCGRSHTVRAGRSADTGSMECDEVICPCGHIEGELVQTWRKGFDFVEAQAIAKAASQRGMKNLTDQQAVEISNEIEA